MHRSRAFFFVPAEELDEFGLIRLVGAEQFEFVSVLAEERCHAEVLAQSGFEIVDISVNGSEVHVMFAGIDDIEELPDLFISREFHICSPF